MKYKIHSSDFIAASNKLETLPKPKGFEVCVLGRSNVGKSSLINRLLERKKLARTGKTPGSTKNICMYKLSFGDTKANSKSMHIGTLSDLPGYGYAKTSNENRELWSQLITSYLINRTTLKLVLLLVDIRRNIEEEERQILEMGKEGGMILVLTKSDKVSRVEKDKRMAYFLRESGLPNTAIVSISTEDASYKKATDALRDTICEYLIG